MHIFIKAPTYTYPIKKKFEKIGRSSDEYQSFENDLSEPKFHTFWSISPELRASGPKLAFP